MCVEAGSHTRDVALKELDSPVSNETQFFFFFLQRTLAHPLATLLGVQDPGQSRASKSAIRSAKQIQRTSCWNSACHCWFMNRTEGTLYSLPQEEALPAAGRMSQNDTEPILKARQHHTVRTLDPWHKVLQLNGGLGLG